jgi:hypothetical protein
LIGLTEACCKVTTLETGTLPMQIGRVFFFLDVRPTADGLTSPGCIAATFRVPGRESPEQLWKYTQ